MKDSGKPIAPLSPVLRAVVERLRENDDVLCRSIYENIRGTISDYSLSTDTGLSDDLLSTLTWHARVWHEALLDAQLPSEELLAKAELSARRRVHQGIALDSFLRAFRIGSSTLWQNLIEAAKGDVVLEKELLLNVSPYLLHHFDIISHRVAQAYMDELFQQASWRDRVRGELWSVISARRDDVEAFSRYCGLLNMDAMTLHIAMVFAVRGASEDTRLNTYAFRKILSMAGMDHENSMYMRYRDHLVMWVPAGRGEPLVDGDRRVGTHAHHIVERVEKMERVGVGLPGKGPAGWWTSLEQAFRAIEHGGESGTRVTRYSQILLDEAIAHSSSVQRFLDAILERLAVEPHLLETLQAYFQCRQHRKSTASALNVHPNTLDHRLQRIELLLGGSFDDMTWLATLSAVLRRRRGDPA
ncbi:PucR family transcriptional regulator [Solilutibacter silvestris]|uniref:PucR C-terminal helix-turn-helix protein n=1 Tax=Solilutibacter silvestris TaxID=1645665 RepID=A0A2K1Q0A5_9GAMM|nr:helix-turn-helix domain-containing protein [Lysobacter silvestris]PNS08468.1 PucR C-terminal helix-turn-helix protein [Lysobacter silvestris]